MPWYLNLLALFGFIFGLIWLLSRLASRWARRTIRNWYGHGAVADLTPPEAGILLGVHPARIVAAQAVWLELRARVRLFDDVPPRVEWIGGPVQDEVETAFRGALSETGRFSPEGSARFIEVIYDRVNRALVTGSGRATAVSYRSFVRSLWEEDRSESVTVEGLEAWMILWDPGRDWERLGRGSASAPVKRAYRFAGRLRADLFSEDFLVERVRAARDGFFRYRRDLIPTRTYHRHSELEMRLDGALIDSENDSDPRDG